MSRIAEGARLRFVSFGVTMELICPDEAMLERASEALPPRWQPADAASQADVVFELSRPAEGPRRPTTLRVDGAVTVTALRVATVLDALETAVRAEVGRRAPDVLFVHAGVVAMDGIAIVLPGRSGSGKTSLVEALLQVGAQYGSDDYAAIDRHGMVHPYPRRLSIRQGPDRRHRARPEDVAEAATLSEALPVGLIVVTEYREGASWAPTRLSSGQAAMALLHNTLAARDRPLDALAMLAKATERATALAGPRGPATDSALQILAASRAARSTLSSSKQ